MSSPRVVDNVNETNMLTGNGSRKILKKNPSSMFPTPEQFGSSDDPTQTKDQKTESGNLDAPTTQTTARSEPPHNESQDLLSKTVAELRLLHHFSGEAIIAEVQRQTRQEFQPALAPPVNQSIANGVSKSPDTQALPKLNGNDFHPDAPDTRPRLTPSQLKKVLRHLKGVDKETKAKIKQGEYSLMDVMKNCGSCSQCKGTTNKPHGPYKYFSWWQGRKHPGIYLDKIGL